MIQSYSYKLVKDIKYEFENVNIDYLCHSKLTHFLKGIVMNRKRMISLLILSIIFSLIGNAELAAVQIDISSSLAKYSIDSVDGSNIGFTDLATSTNYYDSSSSSKCAILTKNSVSYEASSASYSAGQLTIQFGAANVSVVIDVVTSNDYFTFKVNSISNSSGVEKLTFINVPLTNEGNLSDSFPCTVIAANLKTRIDEFPGSNCYLGASCYPSFGLTGAKAAVVAAPKNSFRGALKNTIPVLNAIDGLPVSTIGGPWAMDSNDNYGSYLFDFDGITSNNVNSWALLTQSLGFKLIDWHTGQSMRWGDYLQIGRAHV